MGALGQAVFDGTAVQQEQAVWACWSVPMSLIGPSTPASPAETGSLCPALLVGGGTPLPAPTLLGSTGPPGPSTGAFLMQFLLLFLAVLHNLWDLGSPTRDQPGPRVVKAQSLKSLGHQKALHKGVSEA